MDTIQKLRDAYAQIISAKKSVNTAHEHSTDSGMVWGLTMLADENLDRAMKLIEEVAKELKPK